MGQHNAEGRTKSLESGTKSPEESFLGLESWTVYYQHIVIGSRIFCVAGIPTPLLPFPPTPDETVYNVILTYGIMSYPCMLGMGVRQLVYF